MRGKIVRQGAFALLMICFADYQARRKIMLLCRGFAMKIVRKGTKVCLFFCGGLVLKIIGKGVKVCLFCGGICDEDRKKSA